MLLYGLQEVLFVAAAVIVGAAVRDEVLGPPEAKGALPTASFAAVQDSAGITEAIGKLEDKVAAAAAECGRDASDFQVLNCFLIALANIKD